MAKKQKYLRLSFQKSQFQSELIYFFKFVHPSFLLYMPPRDSVIFVSSLNVLNCNFYLSRNLVALFPLTEFR